ncbi:hypothetical protein GW796_05635 [archaeon]|nr:hypothetical protein [archaeon]NCQ51366.1 hypothetical protein [archaeon]NCT58808.1 hypothetical protein [archaeon]
MIRFKEFITENKHYSDIEEFKKYWKNKGVDNSITETKNIIKPNIIKIDKENRNKGLGTDFMKDLISYADKKEKILTLSPTINFGATSKKRLINFFKRFDFVENKGRNINYQFSDSMYREPK